MNPIRVSLAAVCVLAIASATHAQSGVNQHAVPSGTRFLASLDAPLSTRDAKAGDHFEAATLEPLVAIDGTILRA